MPNPYCRKNAQEMGGFGENLSRAYMRTHVCIGTLNLRLFAANLPWIRLQPV